MTSPRSLRRWSLEELMAEVRHRSRKRAAGKRAAAGPRAGLHEGLSAVPTPVLIEAARRRQRLVYGVDNRKDLFQVTQPKIRRAADAVVALVKAADLRRERDGGFALATTSYREEYALCRSERFAAQPLGCFCSGFLVAPDVIATAGHCVKRAADLARIRFVFGFRMLNGAAARTRFPADDVYAGAALLGRRQTENGADWALVRLDRPVTNHRPVTVRRAGKIAAGQSLFVIGHPNGLPTKFADGARVRDNSPVSHFVANLDTYGGNSGSPVFNRATYRVEGILVRGDTDFVSRDGCNVSMVCPDTGCRGEDVTRSTVWAGKVSRRRP